MNKSQIFYTEQYKKIEKDIINLLNNQPDFLSSGTVSSTRAVGEAIQAILSANFRSILGEICQDYDSDFARRAMADLAFTDKNGFYYRVDVKTHRLDTHFNMPNLTSVERIARFYEDDKNYFVIMMVSYSIKGVKVIAKNCHFVPIEFLSWNCLTVGALGWGQVQIANANTININHGYLKKRWRLELCEVMLDFYPKEIEKIGGRIDYFKRLKQHWKNKVEV